MRRCVAVDSVIPNMQVHGELVYLGFPRPSGVLLHRVLRDLGFAEHLTISRRRNLRSGNCLKMYVEEEEMERGVTLGSV
jgi:hypothetical protein